MMSLKTFQQHGISLFLIVLIKVKFYDPLQPSPSLSSLAVPLSMNSSNPGCPAQLASVGLDLTSDVTCSERPLITPDEALSVKTHVWDSNQ